MKERIGQALPNESSPEIRDHAMRLALIEAALYVAGKPLDLKTLASIIRTRSKRLVLQLARTLKQEYEDRSTSLQILELQDERFVMQLKADFSPKVQRLATRPLLTTGPLKTLSYIAYRQPVPQKQVLAVRGNHIYNHLKQLEQLGLISREPQGRTRIIRTTRFFADYFGLSHDSRVMKRQLKKKFSRLLKPDIELNMQ
ncbi:MAG: SMC-Scp complex subunit ScpB [Candidatus Bathyarchaeota archaeon]|nr:MAG: SMC-Scp complex subunit ScpB [Candidatus Bathyarchaeota archaeon]